MNLIHLITIWIPVRIPTKQDTICDVAYSPFYATSFVITFYQAFNIGIFHFIKVTGKLTKKQDITDEISNSPP